jgi:Carboxypeptidase regulatory-like domain
MKASRFHFGIVALLVVTACVIPVVSGAQSDAGSIDGRVLDETNAALSGASITARNVETGLSRNVASSARGTFRIRSLPPGEYEVLAEVTGRAKQLQRVMVQVSSTAIANFSIFGSTESETVVASDQSLVSATSSDVGQSIGRTLVENIPLNGRRFQDLSLLVPGARQASHYEPTKRGVGDLSLSGASGRSVLVNVDGGDNTDGVVGGLLQQFSCDAIQEYKVITNRYGAEYGRSQGGVVNVVTKSGARDLHGSAFLFIRDQRLNARTFFEEQAGSEKPDFDQQQFGGTLGGPISRERSRFFVSYERNRRNESVQVTTNGVLPDQEGVVAKPIRSHLFTGRLDFQLSEKHSAYLRYSLEEQKRENDFVGGNIVESAGALNRNRVHSGVFKDTSVLGGTRLNEFVVLFQHSENDITANDDTTPQIVTPDFTLGASDNTPQRTTQRRWQLRDDFSFRKEGWGGDHEFKLGAELLASHYGGFFIPTLYGSFVFNSQLPGGVNSYLNGIADTWTGSGGTNLVDEDWTYAAGYVQDDWKPTRRLSLNLGMRYEVQSGPYANSFHPIGKQALAAAGFPGRNENDRNNIGPRVGFAYDVRGDARLVLRGGYGKYYAEILRNMTRYEAWSDPATALNPVTLSPPPFTPRQYTANANTIRNALLEPTFAGELTRITAPDLVQPQVHQFNAGAAFQPAKNVAFDLDYVHSSGQHQVHRWQINTAANLNTRISPAGVFAPELGALRIEGNRGHSRFDAVYVAGRYRTRRTQVLAGYGWSVAKNSADDFDSEPSDLSNLDFERDFGYAADDVRHRVTGGGVFELGRGVRLSSALQWNTGKPFTAALAASGSRGGLRAIDPATGQLFARNSFRTFNPLRNPAFGQFDGKDGAFFTWDVRLAKSFGLPKERSVEVLVEVFNITNHVNFLVDPNQGFGSIYTANNFGTPTQVVPNSQRQAEFGVRFRF